MSCSLPDPVRGITLSRTLYRYRENYNMSRVTAPEGVLMTTRSLTRLDQTRSLHGHVEVLIVGAGISGIGLGHHLTTKQPGRTFAIVDSRDAIGGTWDLFRYPGIRSDSDLHTFGYEFKPWTNKNAIADAHE